MIHLNPEVLSIGNLHIRWYGIMAALGVCAGYWLLNRRRKNYGMTADNASDLVFFAMVGALLGARALYVIRFWEEQFAGNFAEVFKIYNGGLVFFGGFCGAAATILLLCAIKKWPVWKVADWMAPSIALGHAFGRLGCLLNGCCHGFEYQGFGAIMYNYMPIPTFPLQFFSAMLNILLCLSLLWLEARQHCRKHLFLVYILLYNLGRFCLEFGRGDYPQEQLCHGLTPAQTTCLWFAPAIALLYLLCHLIGNKPQAQTK